MGLVIVAIPSLDQVKTEFTDVCDNVPEERCLRTILPIEPCFQKQNGCLLQALCGPAENSNFTGLHIHLYQINSSAQALEGVPQIQVALKPNALLVSFAVFDVNGKMTAKLVDSTLMFNERRAYEVEKAPSRVTLTHVESKNIVLQMELKNPDLVAFTKGGFHTVKGHLLEVSPTEWKVDIQRSSGTTQDVQGGAVKIG